MLHNKQAYNLAQIKENVWHYEGIESGVHPGIKGQDPLCSSCFFRFTQQAGYLSKK